MRSNKKIEAEIARVKKEIERLSNLTRDAKKYYEQGKNNEKMFDAVGGTALKMMEAKGELSDLLQELEYNKTLKNTPSYKSAKKKLVDMNRALKRLEAKKKYLEQKENLTPKQQEILDETKKRVNEAKRKLKHSYITTKRGKTQSNPVLGIATPWWLIGGIVGFLYMRNSLQRTFGPHTIHDPMTCPDCQAKTHGESEPFYTADIIHAKPTRYGKMFQSEWNWINRKGY